MNLAQILDIARQQYLNDAVIPFRYNNTYLVSLANLAQDEACRRSHILFDTYNITADDVARGSCTSASSATISKLVDSGAGFDSTALNKTVYNLTDDTFATVTVVDSTTRLSLSADIMGLNDDYVVGDKTKAITRICVLSGTATYDLSDKVTDIEDNCYLASVKLPLLRKTQGWLDRYYYKWRDAEGTPKYYLLRKNKITLVPKPDDTINSNTGKDTLIMGAYRLPLTALSLSLNNSPEILEEYHMTLVNGICMYLFGEKQGQNAVNMATIHAQHFAQVFGFPTSAELEEIERILPPLMKLSARW